MFERFRAKRAVTAYAKALSHWHQLRDGEAELLALASSFNGTSTDEIMLHGGEAVFFTVTNAALIEERRGQGHYRGGSSGISVPIASIGGRSVRYHVGATRGHYVQGTPTLTAIDHGTVFVTNQRVVFAGERQTRECDYAKLISVHHDDHDGSTTLSVSNRQKPTVIHYGPALSGAFDFRMELALAHYRGTVGTIVTQLQADLDHVDANRPNPPAAVTR